MAGTRRRGTGSTGRTPGYGCIRARHRRRSGARRWSASIVLVLAAWGSCGAQAGTQAGALPDAPQPRPELLARIAGTPAAATPDPAAGQETFPPTPPPRHSQGLEGLQPNWVPLPRRCMQDACSSAMPAHSCCELRPNAFHQYLERYAMHIYTRRELARLAIHGVIDPFNLLTIAGTSAYSVAVDPHSPWGPGALGIAKLSGVTLSQDITGEFFGTFLIPSLDHQDPHYHRMPNAPLARRIAHCAYQLFWTDSDTGEGMVNYATIFGSMADEAVGVTYLPYQQTNWKASAQRIALGWSTDPIGNFITEFVPDVARHINVRVVFLQRVINRVAIEEGGGPAAMVRRSGASR